MVGPLLRYVGRHDATVWVETDQPCEVEVLGRRSRTFAVCGHHYALVCIEGLDPATIYPYEVALDGHTAWPDTDAATFPPSSIRTRAGDDHDLRIAFGSCRVAYPHERPFSLRKDDNKRGREVDALYAMALRMRHQDPDRWPDLLLWLGDQVYADEISPGVREFIDGRPPQERNGCPTDEVADFEEYARLYWDAWRDPAIRWLISTVPSAMIFDDHDVIDDWNTSEAWVHMIRRRPWWHERIVSAYVSYWVYQHLGNLSPDALEEDEIWRLAEQSEDVTEPLRALAERAEDGTTGTRFTYTRDFGRTRLIVMDSRAGRVLDGTREMVDDVEWEWIVDKATGDFDHLLLGTSLPYLLAPAIHHLEAWNEAVCSGAWGGQAAKLGERMRQGLDLEHWAAFNTSFRKLTTLIEEVASGRRGTPPATIVALSGDVHHAYLAEAGFPGTVDARSRAYQAVCSPYRNPLGNHERFVIRRLCTGYAARVTQTLARAAGVPDPDIEWQLADPPIFDNQVATLELSGRSGWVKFERTRPEDGNHPVLHLTAARRLS
ncbi:MAG TPA: alkaline phosphatase D family protein [Solirubrobacteraceae bacterium]|nr:alkaline phosphatase D family protein [Solirubrobacteraceae bacterium]